LGCGENEDGGGNDDESGNECGREMAGGKSAGASAGIGGVDGGVGEAIEGHGSRAGRDHGDDDPEQLMGGGKAGGGEHSSAEREGESEDGVFPLDHFEGDAKVAKQGHGKIVEQDSCQFCTSLLVCRFTCWYRQALGGALSRRKGRSAGYNSFPVGWRLCLAEVDFCERPEGLG